MDDIVFQSLGEHSVVLTANRRLANYFQQQYAQYQRIQNKVIWVTPKVLPLSTWLFHLWNKIENQCSILNNIQEHCLWKKISQQHWASIQTIQQAWETLHHWDIQLARLKEDSSDAVKHFFQWAGNFKTHCQENQWISAAEIPQQLLKTKRLESHLPQSIFLSGFDEFPPVISKLLQKLEAHCTIKTIPLPALKSKIKRFELEDQESELYQMASWALEEYKKNPTKKIGCVIPNLTSIRQTVVRLFSETCSDHSIFNISAGQHLNEFLIIQTALQALRGEWENILQSPYLIQSEDDKEVTAIVDKMRRSNNLIHCETQALVPFFISSHTRFPQSTYLKRWNALLQFKKSLPETQTLNQWLENFSKILQILQWPGRRTLNSVEHQIMQRWLSAQEELISCNTIFGEIDDEKALAILNYHINHIIFQPKTNTAPIQILGILETAGMSFDSLWIMSLDNENWPPPASPNPFLPYTLQIQQNMPHASAERELQFTQHTMKRLLSSAHDIFLSSPKQEGDRQLAASQLITDIEKSSVSIFLAVKENIFNFSNHSLMETINDQMGIPLTENKEIKGGTAVLKYQAICPFKAYASFRLGAEPLETPTLGLSPKMRGQLLHQALELIWKQLQSQAYLLSISDQQLNEIISIAINKIIDTQAINKTDFHFLAIEKKRLQKIINDWLSLEKERTPFTVIHQERKQQITIGTLLFQCRIDRIDQLENGTRIIIDYKTGYSNLHDWFNDRPSDPQLPIYCVFSDEKIYDGLAFAQVRAGAMQFKGIISDKVKTIHDNNIFSINDFDNADEIKQWDTLTTHWKTVLENLSHTFHQGYADVNPLESACHYCELQPLCRVNECQN